MMRCIRSLLLTLAATLSASAAAIAFTVQVIAVSDQETALSISRDLLREGFPTYVVRSTGAQGDVYRVRIGAFANRSAALLYAESMNEVAGSRPVPALAEAIPEGIMPLAPRLLWHGSWEGEDVRVMPWPGGIALRIQRGDPLRQALYLVFQDGEERRFEAWDALPLAALPEPVRPPELEIPLVDLTQPRLDTRDPAPAVDTDAPEPLVVPEVPELPAAPGESIATAPEDLEGTDDHALDDLEDPDERALDDLDAAEVPDAPAGLDAPAPPEPEPPAETGRGEPETDEPAAPDPEPEAEAGPEAAEPPDAAAPLERLGVALADPGGEEPEVGLLLLRDRSLWPPAWEADPEETRQTFRSSLLAITARELGMSEEQVDALAYHPGGELPPSVVVLDLSDRSARDAGRIVALGDPTAGMRPYGPPQLVPDAGGWSWPTWPATRVRRDIAPPDRLGGPDWVVASDDGFLRLTLADGTSWRAGVGTPLWSDGRAVLSWDGERLLLYDFVAR